MYVSNRIVYLQLQKTGCTHIAKLLQKYDGGQIIGKHNPLIDWKSHLGKEIIASIRSPWAWYVSLWAFGCARRGKVYRHLTTTPESRLKQAITRRSPRDLMRSTLELFRRDERAELPWDVLYSDPDNAENFRKWLLLILGEEGKRILPEEYSQTTVKEVVGFFTYRYLQLSIRHDLWEEAKFKINTRRQVEEVFAKDSIVKRTIRNEHLEVDLQEILFSLGLEVSETEMKAQGKTNASSHRPFASYYDQETSSLVLDRERIIVTKFGYDSDVPAYT
jgi:hypothetical protein